MIIKDITKAANTYFNVEQEVLAGNQLSCRCDNPGYKHECLECSCYLEVIKQVQAKIYNEPEVDCIIPSQEKYLVKDSSREYSKEEREKAILLYKELGNVSKVGRQLKISEFVIYKWLHEEGLIRDHSFFSAEVKENAVKIYYEVNSYAKASEITGIPPGNIRNWVKALEERGTIYLDKRSSPILQQAIVDSYNSVKSTRSVAELLGINRKTVQKYLKKAGVL